MPITQICFASIDREVKDQLILQKKLTEYGMTDLLFYRDGLGTELEKLQSKKWNKLLDWTKDEFKLNLAMSLSAIINILDPDAFIFGGGVSNEIDFLSEIESMVKKFVIGKEYDGIFLKPKYGDASGVRGAARLGRRTIY